MELSSECLRMHHLKSKVATFSGGGPPDPPNTKGLHPAVNSLLFKLSCKHARHLIHIGQNCSDCDICIVLSSARDRSTHFQRIFQQPGLTPVYVNSSYALLVYSVELICTVTLYSHCIEWFSMSQTSSWGASDLPLFDSDNKQV